MSPPGGSVPVLLHHGGKHPHAEDPDPGHGDDAAERLPGEHPETLGQDRRDGHPTGTRGTGMSMEDLKNKIHIDAEHFPQKTKWKL